MDISRLCCSVFTLDYPSPSFPDDGVFVQTLVRNWKDLGVDVTVVRPKRISKIIRDLFRKKHNIERVTEVVSPYFMTYSSYELFGVSARKYGAQNFRDAALAADCQLSSKDFYYGKFIAHGASASGLAGSRFDKPSFADLGESSLPKTISYFGKRWVNQALEKQAAIFCVSEDIIEQVNSLGVDREHLYLAPNGADLDRFHPLNQIECRKTLDIAQDEFVVAFIGRIGPRKGAGRVLRALENDGESKGIFIGRGPEVLRGDSVLHSGVVPNSDIPVYLNAADIYVLPTRAEGHCNSIEEAMACGLPVITSNISSVKAKVPDNAAFFVDPADISQMSHYIKKLRESDKLRREMSSAAICHSKEYSAKSRAQKIIKTITQYL